VCTGLDHAALDPSRIVCEDLVYRDIDAVTR
jgi:hypothetical protein